MKKKKEKKTVYYLLKCVAVEVHAMGTVTVHCAGADRHTCCQASWTHTTSSANLSKNLDNCEIFVLKARLAKNQVLSDVKP